MPEGLTEKEYTLGFADEPGRRLTGISASSIHFNISGWLKFKSREEVAKFFAKWQNHFFNTTSEAMNFRTLVIFEDTRDHHEPR